MLIQSSQIKATTRPLAAAQHQSATAATTAPEDAAKDSLAPARNYRKEQMITRGVALGAGAAVGIAAGTATALLSTGASIGIGAGVFGAIGVAGGVLLAGLSGLGPKDTQVSPVAGAAFYGATAAGVGALAGWLGGPVGGAVVGLVAGAATYFGTGLAIENAKGRLG